MHPGFWGWDKAVMPAVHEHFEGILTPCDLYAALMTLYSADTCAPRMRSEWPRKHPTYGQCSITAFLVQDIFGGKVLGVPLGDGNFHCFNQIGKTVFDLTSEQFGSQVLDYANCCEQLRDDHFRKVEKHARYLLLRQKLMDAHPLFSMTVHDRPHPAAHLAQQTGHD
ncbi:MAG: hypothetical protein IJ246_08335 [Clostridia bacterium]|nr:hypothetical protein [Clostridia bacterium]